MNRTIPYCLAAALGGCTSPPTEESTAAPKPVETPVDAPVEAAPKPASTTTKTPAETKTEPETKAAPSKDPGAAPTPAPAPADGLHVIARSEAGFQLHPLIDGTLLVSAGPLVMRVDERGELVHDLSMLRGLESIRPWVGSEDDGFEGVAAWGPVALGGRWPDAVYLSLDVESGFRSEGGIPVVYRHTDDGWAKLATRGTHYDHYPAELHPWIEGSILARRVYQPYFKGQERWEGDEGGPTERQLEVAKKAIEDAKKLVVIRGVPQAPDVAATVVAFDSRATGEIFAVTGDTPPTLVRLDAAGARQTVALPGTDPEVRGVVADGTDRAWIFGATRTDDKEQPWLVRVEGEHATTADVPSCSAKGLASFVVLEDGAQWATCGEPPDIPHTYDEHELWQRPAGGTWARPGLPPDVDTPRRVVARGADDVWVVASDKDGDVLLHSRPRETLLGLPSLAVIGRQMLEWNDPLPVTKTCSFPFVPLRSPPADAETVKAALDGPLRKLEITAFGIALVSTTIRGQALLGLQINMPDKAPRVAQRVATAATAALGKEMVDEPRCWFAKESEDGPLARWDSHREP
jgi:hypothetical protein